MSIRDFIFQPRSDHGERVFVRWGQYLLCKTMKSDRHKHPRRDGHDQFWCDSCNRYCGGV